MSMNIEASKLKVKLKQWEAGFFVRTNRKPNKIDIAKAHQDIQDAYKKFWKLTKDNNAVANVEKKETTFNDNPPINKVERSLPNSNVWSGDLNKVTATEKPKKVTGSFLTKIGQKLKRNVENLQRKDPDADVRSSHANDESKRRHEMRCVLRQLNDTADDDDDPTTDFNFNVKISTAIDNHSGGRPLSVINPQATKTSSTITATCHSYPGLTKNHSLNVSGVPVTLLEPGNSPTDGLVVFNPTHHVSKPSNPTGIVLEPSEVSVTLQIDTMQGSLSPHISPTVSSVSQPPIVAIESQLSASLPVATAGFSISYSGSLPQVSCNSVRGTGIAESFVAVRDKSKLAENPIESVDVFEFGDTADSEPAKPMKRKTVPRNASVRASRVEKSVQDPPYMPNNKPSAATPKIRAKISAEVTSGNAAVRARSARQQKKKTDDKDIKESAETEPDEVPKKSAAKTRQKKAVRKLPNVLKEFEGESSGDDASKSDNSKVVGTKKRRRPVKEHRDLAERPEKVAKTSDRRYGNGDRPVPSRTVRRTPAPTENYVRINLRKKVFCRGSKKFNYRRYKYDRWKQLQDSKRTGEESVQSSTSGCGNRNGSGDACIANDDDDLNRMMEGNDEADAELRVMLDVDPVSKDKVAAAQDVPTYAVADPLFEPTADGSLPPTVLRSVRKSLKRFGHDSFRPGQLESIGRVLSGRSTLVLQPTGAGKSLCYLLAAHLYAQRSSCITIVISPLVSLMDDQVSRVPSFLRAESLHTNMTRIRREKVREAVCRGEVDILFLSPEAVVGGAGSPFGCLPPEMPPIAFVCIDEVHCISSWSHNFRPSYLRLCWVVHEKLKVRCVLGLTATITRAALENVSQHLRLPEEDTGAVVRASPLPSNLFLTVSRDNDEQALLHLLRTEPFVGCRSIIVYCIRREQTERLATLIRTCLREGDDEWSAEAYHAGLTPARRRTIQNKFMSGALRLITATVAFGMGLNKSDVRGIIHHSMPKSVESYVQEIGRAGRDGRQSFCHLFLDVRGDDRRELKRHIYADSVDRSTLAKLLRLVFVPCRCSKLREMEMAIKPAEDVAGEGTASGWKCPGHEVAFSLGETVQALDVKEEGVDTLLAQLEMHPSRCLEVLNRTYGTCNLLCYNGAQQLLDLAATCPPVAYALAMARRRKRCYSIESDNRIEFPIVEVAAALGTDSGHLRRQLRQLAWTEVTGAADGRTRYRKSGIMIEFKDLYFHVRSVGDLKDDDVDGLVDYLHAYVCRHEESQIEHLDTFYSTLNSVSSAHHWACEGELANARSERLKEIVRGYFDGSERLLPATNPDVADEAKANTRAAQATGAVRSDVRNLLSVHHDHSFTGRAIARIFHGIGSPLYPAEIWGRVRQFWRSHLDYDFNMLRTLATEEIVNFKRRGI